jgi:hypothetical protein
MEKHCHGDRVPYQDGIIRSFLRGRFRKLSVSVLLKFQISGSVDILISTDVLVSFAPLLWQPPYDISEKIGFVDIFNLSQTGIHN